jgi:flagellar hook-length control protein FliK
MTTDRTQPARPAAPTDRPSAAPAERREGSAFAALLDAHAPAPRRDDRGPEPRDAAARHDRPQDAAGRHDRPRDAAGHDQRPDGAVSQHEAAPGDGLSRDAARNDLLAALPPALAATAVPEAPAATPAQPVAVPPFVAKVPAEAPAAPVAPPFMVAPESIAAVVPATPQPVVVAVVAAEVPATPQPALPAPPQPAAAAVPATPQPAVPTPQPQEAALDAPQLDGPQAPTAELPAEPAAEAPVPHAATPARAAVAAEPAPSAAPAAVQAPPAEPVAQAPVSTPLSGRVGTDSVPLYRAPAAVSTLLHVAVERGITRARMALRPAELGGIEIRLQATAGGIAAQVVADSPEAARLLAQAGDDLRRALEARDVTLISLEVSTSSDERQRHSARGDWSGSRDADLTTDGRTIADGDAEPAPTTQTVIELPGGLLVDVLA